MITHAQIIYLSNFLSLYHISWITMAAHTLNVMSYHNSNTFFKILVTRDIKMLIYAYLSYSSFAPCICSSHIHSQNTLRMLISTSTLLINIVTITKTRECQVIQISIPHEIFHQEMSKKYSLETLTTKVSRYFYGSIVSNCIFEISNALQIYFRITS